MRSTGKPTAAVQLLAAALLGCAAADEHTTLAELERDGAGVRASIERDVCSCSCGKLVCWDFSCSGDGCSRADEYELIVARDADAGDGACFDAATALQARLIDGNREPLLAEATTHGCAEPSLRWRRPPAGLESRPHRIEISDDSGRWTIDDPFALVSLELRAPASALPTSAMVAATAAAGDAIVLGLTPPGQLTQVRASLRSSVTHDAIELPVGNLGEEQLEVIVPADTPPGPYQFELGAGTLLPSGACRGPAFCQGVDVGTTFALRVE